MVVWGKMRLTMALRSHKCRTLNYLLPLNLVLIETPSSKGVLYTPDYLGLVIEIWASLGMDFCLVQYFTLF